MRHDPRLVAPLPKGATHSAWSTRCFCHMCGFHSDRWYEVSPCKHCRASGFDNTREYTARFVRFGLLYRALCALTGRDQPQDYWEFK